MGENIIEMNDARFQKRLEELHDALIGQGKTGDAATIIEDEARLFLKQAIGFTPPNNRAQGEQAIRDDVSRLFTPANEMFLLEEFSAKDRGSVDQWFTNRGGDKVHVQWDYLDIHGFGMEKSHQRQRNARGRVSGHDKGTKVGNLWKARYVVSYDAFATYLAKVQARVGMMKAGWLRAYYEVGGKLPNWIQRHVGRDLGGCVNNLAVPGRPSIRISNHAPGIGSQQRILSQTFRARSEAMAKRIRLVVSGYARDVKQGIKIANKARRTATD